MHGVFDALISAATADVARHRFAYLVVIGLWIFDEECRGLHDLAGLAIPALWAVQLAPVFLNRVIRGRVRAFDGCNLPVDPVGNRGDAGANGLPPTGDHAVQ